MFRWVHGDKAGAVQVLGNVLQLDAAEPGLVRKCFKVQLYLHDQFIGRDGPIGTMGTVCTIMHGRLIAHPFKIRSPSILLVQLRVADIEVFDRTNIDVHDKFSMMKSDISKGRSRRGFP